MFSRIGKVIFDHSEGIGLAFTAVSFFWLMGVAGADDFSAMHHIFTPLLPLIVKSVFGLVGMGLGVALVNMKGGNESVKQVHEFADLPTDETEEIERILRGGFEA